MELLSTVTQDGFGVQVVLHRDEDETNPDHHAGHLVVELEQRTVQQDPVLLEILNNLLEDGQLVLDIGRHGGGGGTASRCSL